jgi:hypothetical protein
MATVTVIFLDGYKGWNVSRTKSKVVMGEFTPELCRDVLVSVEGMGDEESELSLQELCGDEPVHKGNVITCMGEESGVVFVYT